MIRVLHIAEAAGGVERYLVTLIRKMKKHSDIEHILICSKTYETDKFKGLVKGVRVIDSMRHEFSFLNDIKAINEIRKAIKDDKPDIVYCHGSKAGAIGRVANFCIKKKLIYNAHGWAFNMKDASARAIKMYATLEKLLSLFVYPSVYPSMRKIEHWNFIYLKKRRYIQLKTV